MVLWQSMRCEQGCWSMHQESPPGKNSNRPLFLMSNICQPCVICSLIFKNWHGFCPARICRFVFSETRNTPRYPWHVRCRPQTHATQIMIAIMISAWQNTNQRPPCTRTACGRPASCGRRGRGYRVLVQPLIPGPIHTDMPMGPASLAMKWAGAVQHKALHHL